MSSRSITFSQLFTIRKWITPWSSDVATKLIEEKYPTLEAAHKLISQGPRSYEVAALKEELRKRSIESGRKSLEQAQRNTV